MRTWKRERLYYRLVLCLSLDTSTPGGSCAVTRDGILVCELSGDPNRPHDARLPGDLMALVEAARIDLGEIDLYADLSTLAGRPLDLADLRARQRAQYLERCNALALRPGLADLLEAARDRGLALAVASSSGSGWVERWLERHAIRPYFGCVRSSEHVQHVKPAPDLFLSAAAGLGVAPEHCLVFEDSPNGMRAAAAAGMRHRRAHGRFQSPRAAPRADS